MSNQNYWWLFQWKECWRHMCHSFCCDISRHAPRSVMHFRRELPVIHLLKNIVDPCTQHVYELEMESFKIKIYVRGEIGSDHYLHNKFFPSSCWIFIKPDFFILVTFFFLLILTTFLKTQSPVIDQMQFFICNNKARQPTMRITFQWTIIIIFTKILFLGFFNIWTLMVYFIIFAYLGI